MRTPRYVMAVVTVSLLLGMASTASASAHAFNASASGTLSATALAPQVFHVGPAGTFECDSVSAAGTIAAGVTESLGLDVTYEDCESYGHPVQVSVAEFALNADGSVNILKPIILTMTVKKILECTLTIDAQTLSTITYDNKSGKIELVPDISGIASSGTGIFCEYASSKEGVFEGDSEVTNSGGTLEWS